MTAAICTCPVEATIHHPSCPRDGLLRDVGAFELAGKAQSGETEARAGAMRAPRTTTRETV
jgi:hypothetical protein